MMIVHAVFNLIALVVMSDSTTDMRVQSVVREVVVRRERHGQCSFEVSTYSLADANKANFDALSGEKKLVSKARVTCDGDVKLIEYLGDVPGAELSPGNPLNEISSVTALDSSICYDYIPIPNGGNPLANVDVYDPNDPRVRLRVDQLMETRDASGNVFGQKIEAFFNDPNLRLVGDSPNHFTLAAVGMKDGISYRTSFEFDSGVVPELVAISLESREKGNESKLERSIT